MLWRFKQESGSCAHWILPFKFASPFLQGKNILAKIIFFGGVISNLQQVVGPLHFFTSRIGLLSFFDRVFIVFLSMLIRIIELATARAANIPVIPENNGIGITVWAVHHHASQRNPQDLHWYMPSTLSSMYLPTS